MSELKFSLIISVICHIAFIYIAATGIPYFKRDLPTIDRPVPVEIVNVDDVTRVKKPEPRPEPEEVKQAVAEPVRSRPRETTETPIPLPDAKPKLDPTELERKELAKTVTPLTKPRPPTSFDAGKIAALIDKSIKETPTQTVDREKELEEAVNRSQIAGIEARRNTASIEDFIKAKMRDCWTPPAGAVNINQMQVIIRINLGPDGYLIGPPKIQNRTEIFASNNPYYRAAAEGALRAVRLCEPYELPKELYDRWKELELNFDPSEMVG